LSIVQQRQTLDTKDIRPFQGRGTSRKAGGGFQTPSNSNLSIVQQRQTLDTKDIRPFQGRGTSRKAGGGF
ncbi:hypothetical protein, partial [Acidaminococcus timonensis]|uniref:hypothetical protein n=1 Tax=Acidaminococcus timonensis TaxID=1871002 RepID=UPI0026F23DBF